jgi:hypothetical protein
MGKAKQIIKAFLGNVYFVFFVIFALLISYNYVLAEPTYNSTNYGVDEVFMGAGGLNDASSTNYQARASLGDLSVGNSVGVDYQMYGGFTTTPDPYISLIVNSANLNLGYLDTASSATTTATFQVKAYLASGYVVTNGSDPPSYTSAGNTHYLSTPSVTPTPSVPGAEQFGINLVANTNPTTFGANPVQIPDSSYSFGQAATNYDTPNVYMYNKGDTIAYSNKSSGYTEYTISYLYNISQATPAGIYSFNHILIATATY